MRLAARSLEERRRLAHLSLAAALSLATVAAIVLHRFPPDVYGFYPLCPVHEYLHLECPGCGSTRALAALLHGHFQEAMRLNALFVTVVLPLSAAYGVIAYARALRGKAFHWPNIPTPAVYAGVGMAIGFMVLRNL